MEERLIKLEIKVAYQEELIQDLRDALDEHWHIIDGLSEEMKAMHAKLSTSDPSQMLDAKNEPPPPHY